MCITIDDCKRIGDSFTAQVADILERHGFKVYTKLYVPYRPGSDQYTEIDITAISNDGIITVECKHNSYPIGGNKQDKTWVRQSPYGDHEIANPLKQSWSHGAALRENFGRPDVFEYIVFSDVNNYCGPQDVRVCSVDEFEDRIEFIINLKIKSPRVTDSEIIRMVSMLEEWEKATTEIKVKHMTDINLRKNEVAAAILKLGVGFPVYCLMIGEYYYCFKDDRGRTWGSLDIGEATLYQRVEEAILTSDTVKNSVVCSMEFGYPELLEDVDNWMDDLTPEEYAYEVGARQW